MSIGKEASRRRLYEGGRAYALVETEVKKRMAPLTVEALVGLLRVDRAPQQPARPPLIELTSSKNFHVAGTSDS